MRRFRREVTLVALGLTLFLSSCAAPIGDARVLASDCGWAQASELRSRSEPELNAALDRHAPEAPLAWRVTPLVWVAPELGANFDRGFAEDAIKAAGFSRLVLMAERNQANFKIWPFFSEGDRQREVGDNVLCGEVCMWDHHGASPRYFMSGLGSPLMLSSSEDYGNPSLPRSAWLAFFEMGDSNDLVSRTSVDGLVRFNSSLRINAAECFINIDLPAAEQRLLISECVVRGLGLTQFASNSGAAFLRERLTPIQTISSGDRAKAFQCLRALASATRQSESEQGGM